MPLDLWAEAFFTADHAAVENGKLYVNGGYWTRLNFVSFPAAQNFAVAVVLHIPWRAHRQGHRFAISFEDADGQKVGGRVEGQFQAEPLPDMRMGDFSLAPLAIQVNGFVLQRAGDYSAVLEVDQTEISRWRFRAAQISAEPAPSAENGSASG